MIVEQFINNYGYLAIFLGTFLEGETVLIIGGFLASRHFLSLSLVILVTFIATMLWDQLFFYLGRKYGHKIFVFKPNWESRIRKILRSIHKNSKKFMISSRFIYGTRTLGPLAIGMSKIPAWEYFSFNFVATLIWSICFGVLGYFFGYSLQIFVGRIRHYEFIIVLLLIIGFAITWPIYRYYMKKSGEI